ncbi:unnamed protein product [Cylicocyclus nassatus]|uniref:DDE Tnp4 domain-containing protein n=1 Tax=Cylicocyclus nassatus TaxID=53992 RepID=A0AA36GP39_CYLNA|nr:unnamed protein product [Cylicocyclus nassatus]
MTSHNIQAPPNVLLALGTMEEMMDYEESVSKARAYVREEHVPFLDSCFRNLDSYIASHNPDNFAHFTRLFPSEFQDLHELGPYLQHEPFHVTPISAQRRLFVYLRFVGHGYAYGALAEELNIGRQTVSDIVSEVTDAINTVLFADAFPTPTRQALEDCAMKTQQRYDYPRAVGFMDGKHINENDRSYFKKPKKCGQHVLELQRLPLHHPPCCLRLRLPFHSHRLWCARTSWRRGVFRNSDIKTFYEVRDDIFPETEELNDVGPVQYHILVDGGFAQSHRYIRPFPEPMATTASKRRFSEKLSG